MNWTKGFKATDCEGEDVVELLREGIKRKEVSWTLYSVWQHKVLTNYQVTRGTATPYKTNNL